MGLLSTIRGWFSKIGIGKTPTKAPETLPPLETKEPQTQLAKPLKVPIPERTGKAEQLNKAIKNEGTTRTPVRQATISGEFVSGNIREEYRQLLRSKVNDSRLIEDIIDARNVILRKRLVAKIGVKYIDGNNITEGTVSLVGLLIEDRATVTEMINNSSVRGLTDIETKIRARGIQIDKIIAEGETPNNSNATIQVETAYHDFQ